MRVIMDTNCFLQIVPKTSKYRSIFDAYRLSNLEFAISNEILEEYAEKFSDKMNSEISNNIIELILENTNTVFAEIFFRWNLITKDYDDNKFVDTYISSNSNYIVTEDSHFRILKSFEFPKINVINLDEFLEVLKMKI